MSRLDARLIIGGIVFLLFFSSCRKNVENRSLKKALDLDSLVDSQVTFLSDNHYGIHKITRLGPREEVVEHYPDSSGWARELDILKKADISKPGIRPYYSYELSGNSSYNIDNFILIDSGRYKTTYQIVYRSKLTDIPFLVQTGQHISNPIYHSSRFIEIVFREIEAEEIVIDSIRVKGYQKIIFRDTAYYSLVSRTIQ
jgi:hypothetical protein